MLIGAVLAACATPVLAQSPYSRTPEIIDRPAAPTAEQAQIELELEPEEIDRFRSFLKRLLPQPRRATLSIVAQLDVGHRGRAIMREFLPDERAGRRLAAYLSLIGPQYEADLARQINRDPIRRWGALRQASENRTDRALLVDTTRLLARNGRCFANEWEIEGFRASADPAIVLPPMKVCDQRVGSFEYAWNYTFRYGPARMIRSEPAGEGEAPWQIQLTRAGKDQSYYRRPMRAREELDQLGRVRKNWERDHVCGAVYIGRNYALTAAHCLEGWKGFDAEFFAARRIRAGTIDIDGKGELIPITAVVTHKAYQEGKSYLGHDIALLVLDRTPAAPATSRARIPLRPHNGQSPGVELIQTGWGLTGATDNSSLARDMTGKLQGSAQFLRIGKLELFDNQRCETDQAYVDRDVKLGYGQICVGSQSGVDACKGDSGGPLVRMTEGAPPILIGIVSWGIGCGVIGRPAIYTDAGTFYRWIKRAQLKAQPGRMIAIE